MRLTLVLLGGLGALLIVLAPMGASTRDKQQPAFYQPLEPAFIVNLREGKHFLRTNLQILTHDEQVVEAVQHHMPVIRHELILLLSERTFEQLSTLEGRNQLRQDAAEAIKKVLEEKIGKPGIETVLFTNFVTQ